MLRSESNAGGRRPSSRRSFSNRLVQVAFSLTALLGLVVALPSAAHAAATGATSLTFFSDPGDYIGQGIRHTWGSGDGTFSASGEVDHVRVRFSARGDLSTWWDLEFAAPAGRPLVPGAYAGATRWPFQSPTKPGLDVGGSGRGCNTSTGRFVVREIVLGAAGAVERFAADFEQHCEGAVPALRGLIRYNASSTFPPPLDTDGDRVPDTLDNCVAASNRAQADGDRDGLGDVCDPVFARTWLTFDSDPGDFIGQGIDRTWYPTDGVFTGVASGNTVEILLDAEDSWRLSFAAPDGHLLQPGAYAGATRFLFQSPHSPGLDVFGAGRGCNAVTGNFVVLDIAVSPGGELLRFAADFEQHCEGMAPALRGNIRFNI